MLWIRGNPADYDSWSQMGCKGWSFDEVLPLLQVDRALRARRCRPPRQAGPILVEDYRTTLDLTHRFVDAAQQAGIPLTRDLNGSQQEGVGYSQMSRNGRFRGSTARTFLAQAQGAAELAHRDQGVRHAAAVRRQALRGVAFRQGGRGPAR